MGITVEKDYGKNVLIESIIFLCIIAMFALFAASISNVKINTESQANRNNAVVIETEEKKPEMVMAPGFHSDIAKMRADFKELQEA